MSKIMLVGITGSIATGKSSVAKYLKDKGYPLFDCDKVVHDLYNNDIDLINQIDNLFDNVVVNKKINRQQLKEIVFSNEENKKQLEELVHPIIKNKLKEFKTKNQNKLSFAEIPLLIEAGMINDVDIIWVVATDYEIQIERLKQRNNLNQEIAEKVIKQQLSIETKKKYANIIIDNNNDWNKTIEQVEKELEKYNNY